MNERGLTSAEARRRLERDGPNELAQARTGAWAAVILEVLREPMIALLVAAAIAYGFLGEAADAVALSASAVFVIVIAVVQELRTTRALEALRELTSPRAIVIRDGTEVRVPGREVVSGDAVLMLEGDRVPADGQLDECEHMQVDESMLTGEALPAAKAVGDRVYSGTLVVAGSATGTITATGGRTRIGAIGGSLRDVERLDTPLQRQMQKLVLRVGFLGVMACLAAVVGYGLLRGQWAQGVLAGLSASISLLPEEIPVVLAVFFALGAWRIARVGVLTRRLPALEALGSATVLCSDKTGTMTLNRMQIAHIEPHALSTIDQVLETAAFASDPRAFDPMDRAIKERTRLLPPHEPLRTYPLSPSMFAMTNVHAGDLEESAIVSTKGAPEAVLALCDLPLAERAEVVSQVESMAARGERVLAVARVETCTAELPLEQRALQLQYVGLLGFEDPVRSGVPESVAQCASAGIRVMMITGDHATTARSIAARIGIAEASRVLSGEQIAAMNDAELAQEVRSTNVFARIAPEQKLRLVRALASNGEVVAMTGDGVNDAPALKAAHIGIAMGERGTDVAREAASIVLVDDDFTSIVDAIRLGRRIFDNIAGAIGYVIVVHVLIAGVALTPIFLLLPLILLPIHIVFIELIVDPTCSIAFEGEPENPEVMHRPPRRAEHPIISNEQILRLALEGLAALAAPLGVLAFALSSGASDSVTRAMVFASFIFINGVTVLMRTSRRNTIALALVAGSCATLALTLLSPFLRFVFHFAVPAPRDWMATIAICSGVALLLAGMRTLGWRRDRK